MPVSIVSRNVIFREMLESAAKGRGIDVADVYSGLSDIVHLHAGDILLVHPNEDCTAAASKIAQLQKRIPGLRVIVLAPDRASDQMRRELSDVSEAIIPETESADLLISLLTIAQQGYRVSSDHLMKSDEVPQTIDLQQVPPPANQPTLPAGADAMRNIEEAGLSSREVTVLSFLREGKSNKEIANLISISEATVKVHLRTVFRKIGVQNRTQAAMWASARLG